MNQFTIDLHDFLAGQNFFGKFFHQNKYTLLESVYNLNNFTMLKLAYFKQNSDIIKENLNRNSVVATHNTYKMLMSWNIQVHLLQL